MPNAPVRATEPKDGWEIADYYLPQRPDYSPIFDFSVDSFWDVVNTYVNEKSGSPQFVLSDRYPTDQIIKPLWAVVDTVDNVSKSVCIVRDWDTEIFVGNNGHNLPIAKENFIEMYLRFLGNGNIDPAFYDSFPNKLVRNTFLFLGILSQFSSYRDENYPNPKEQKKFRDKMYGNYGEVIYHHPLLIMREIKQFCGLIIKAEKKRKCESIRLDLPSNDVRLAKYFAELFLKYSHNDFLGCNMGDNKEERERNDLGRDD